MDEKRRSMTGAFVTHHRHTAYFVAGAFGGIGGLPSR